MATGIADRYDIDNIHKLREDILSEPQIFTPEIKQQILRRLRATILLESKMLDEYHIADGISFGGIQIRISKYGLEVTLQDFEFEVLPLSFEKIFACTHSLEYYSSAKVFDFSLPAKYFTNLRRLNLKRNKLYNLPNEMKKFTSLEELHLYKNNFEKIPEQVFKMKNLRRLYLNDNDIEEIPEEIGRLSSLTHLFLANNNIAHISQKIGKLRNLGQLDLYGNKLGSIPSSFSNLRSIERLSLSHNQLQTIDFDFGKLKQLKVLDLSKNQVKHFPDALMKVQTLVHLNMAGNPISKLPADLFDHLSHIEELSLSSTSLRSLPSSIHNLAKLRYLNLKYMKNLDHRPYLSWIRELEAEGKNVEY